MAHIPNPGTVGDRNDRKGCKIIKQYVGTVFRDSYIAISGPPWGPLLVPLEVLPKRTCRILCVWEHRLESSDGREVRQAGLQEIFRVPEFSRCRDPQG